MVIFSLPEKNEKEIGSSEKIPELPFMGQH
jgi:hypothetical protein